MRYVKVTGENHADALKKLREQYGIEAIIYDERKIKNKTLMGKMLNKEKWEIHAALAEKKSSAEKVKNKMAGLHTMLDKTKPIHPEEGHHGKDFLRKISIREPEDQGRNNLIERKLLSNSISLQKEAEYKAAKDTIDELSLKKLYSELSDIKENMKEFVSLKNKEPEAEFADLYDYLLDCDFSKTYIGAIVHELKESLPRNEWKNKNNIVRQTIELISKRIKTNSSLGTKRVIALVGPTGVGKTTTIAKLAARLKLKNQKKVSLITLDNYRIAATEQLKLYGNIMDIPVHVCKEKGKFYQIIDEEKCDIILVDTTGMSQNNKEFLMRQKDFFEGKEHEIEKHLLMAANIKPKDMVDILENFSIFNVDRIIISKQDETNAFGYLVELAEKWNMPFSFVTTGQKVPDDYLPAEKKYIAEKIMEKFNK